MNVTVMNRPMIRTVPYVQ